MGVSSEAFRAGLKHWASGVTVVTSCHGERIHGMTVSAFTSVSLHPPLVLVCADKSSDTRAVIEAGGVFAANVLACGQEPISNRFAAEGDETRRFEGVPWTAGATGSPLIDGAIAQVDCRVTGVHDAGDHVIYVGEVEDVRTGPGEPLVYYAGRYARLAADGG